MRPLGGLPGGGGKEWPEKQGQGKEEGSVVRLGGERGASGGDRGSLPIQSVEGGPGGGAGRWATADAEVAPLSLS